MKDITQESILAGVNELRDRLKDLIATDSKFNEDYYLAQWLKRQGFKVDRTETAIREALKWRQKNYPDIFNHPNIEEALEFERLQSQDEEEISVTIHSCSQSKQGQPVIFLKGDGADFKKLVGKYGRERVLRHLALLFIKMEQTIISHYSAKSRETLDLKSMGLLIVGSFKNFSLWDAACVDVVYVLLEAAKLATRYFPCLATSVYILNINKFALILFRMMKPIISSQAYTVECFDTNQDKWSAVLSPFIDLEQLSPHLVLKNSQDNE